MKPYKIIISGGGTGGHIYPALAIADTLRQRSPEIQILFIGAYGKMEMEKVPNAGFKIIGLWISGVQRKQLFRNILFPLKLIVSLLKSIVIVLKFKPHVVIGTGGFASGPMLYVASIFGTPTLIQEQNSFPGITNKLLAKKAHKICVAYDNLETFFPKEKIVITGNPVRQDLLDLKEKQEEAHSTFNISPTKKIVLVLGGWINSVAKNGSKNILQKLGLILLFL